MRLHADEGKIGGQRSEIRGQRTEEGGAEFHSVFRPAVYSNLLLFRSEALKKMEKDAHFREQVLTTDHILGWSGSAQGELRQALDVLFRSAFSQMPEKIRKDWIEDHFFAPGGGIVRQVLLFRESPGNLAGTLLFDHGQIQFEGKSVHGVYILYRVVAPEYQGSGLCERIMKKVLLEWRPDLLLTTCAQSSSLHSWMRLPAKGMRDYKIYPRLTGEEGRDCVLALPPEERDSIIRAFEQLYSGVAHGMAENIDKVVRNLTETMVRKEIYGPMFDFDPWNRNGREDRVARALGAVAGDGILLVMRREC